MRKEAWFGLSMMAIVVALVFYILPAPSQMTNGHLGLLMLAMIVVAIMLGFPTAFTLMGLGTMFAFFAYYSENPATAVTRVLDLMALRAYWVMNNDVLISGVPTALVGFYAGHAAAAIFAVLTHYEVWLLLAVAVVAVLVLVTRHLRHAAWVEDLRLADAHRLVPLLIGAMGVVILLSAIWPRHRQLIAAMASWFPLEVTQNSRPLMLMAGIALLQVTRNLARRKELAWYVAVIALSVSLLTHITRAFDLHHSMVAALLLGYLIHFRHRFNARSDPLSLRYALVAAPLIRPACPRARSAPRSRRAARPTDPPSGSAAATGP